MSGRRSTGDRNAAPESSPGDSSEGFDPATGLALTQRLAVRLRDAESRGGGSLVLGTLRVENADALAQRSQSLALRALLGAADALRAALPFVHVLARTGEAELAFLLPNVDGEPEARAEGLIRSVASALAGNPGLNFPLRLEIAFGYAQTPRDGADAAVLLQQARVPRWRIGMASRNDTRGTGPVSTRP